MEIIHSIPTPIGRQYFREGDRLRIDGTWYIVIMRDLTNLDQGFICVKYTLSRDKIQTLRKRLEKLKEKVK